jgi:hypothetical protein
MRYRHLFVIGSLILLAAEPKKPEPKKDPLRVIVAAPLGITPGVKTHLVLRGLRLDNATEVRCQEPKATTKLLKASKVGVPKPQQANRVGDTQIEAEVTLPPDYPNRTVTVSVLTPAGESAAHSLLIDRAPVLAEKEPNNGFREAQPLALPQEVNGKIEPSKDVDLFRFEGKEGQQVTIEVFAARYGSALDPLLTLYDSEGRILASCDDTAGSADAQLDVTLPKSSTYFVGVIDANDQAGPAHVYRLRIRERTTSPDPPKNGAG